MIRTLTRTVSRNSTTQRDVTEANPPALCPGCGRPLTTHVPGAGARGRRRIWCSNACRQSAYRARQKTFTAAPPLPSSAPEQDSSASSLATHDLDDCIVSVLQAPTAVASVLDAVRRALHDGVLDQAEYAQVQAALLALGSELAAEAP